MTNINNSFNSELAPDFIIIGAMKSGTTTLHTMLNSHRDIFIPEDELFYYSYDDVLEHPDLPVMAEQQALNKWYKSKYTETQGATIFGEDSTTYLCSERALKRISQQGDTTKLIVMLRQPTMRAYSQYWHSVKAGRALFSFEETLRRIPATLLSRSQYLAQMRTVYQYFPKDRVKVIIFEEFIKSPKAHLEALSDFLGAEYDGFPSKVEQVHANAAKLPRFIRLQLLKARLLCGNKSAYTEHFKEDKRQFSVFDKLYKFINPLVVKRPPPISPEIKQRLDHYFYTQLEGLETLIDKPIQDLWFDNKND